MDANYNLKGLVERIKIRLDDQEYPDETIKQFINDAYFDALNEAHYQFLERTFEQTVDESGVLTLPPDFQSAIALTAKSSDSFQAFEYMPYGAFLERQQGDGARAYKFTIFGNQIMFDVPKTTENEDEPTEYTIKLYYLAKPMALSNDKDIPLIPYEFGEILVMGALARAERLRDNYDFATVYENKHDELVTNMKLRYCPRQQGNDNRAKIPVSFKARY